MLKIKIMFCQDPFFCIRCLSMEIYREVNLNASDQLLSDPNWRGREHRGRGKPFLKGHPDERPAPLERLLDHEYLNKNVLISTPYERTFFLIGHIYAASLTKSSYKSKYGNSIIMHLSPTSKLGYMYLSFKFVENIVHLFCTTECSYYISMRNQKSTRWRYLVCQFDYPHY